MKWTNFSNLPQSIVRAVQFNDRPKAGPNDISVTTLLRPAQARALEAIHDEEIEQDVADALYRLHGQSVHSVLERGADATLGDVAEKQFYWPLGNIRVTGRVDLIEADGTLADFKTTSVYSFLLGDKDDWTAQANMYRWLAEKNGHKINKLRIIALLRDWQKSKVGPDDPDYPTVPMKVKELEMWPMEKTEQFIRARIEAHLLASKDASSVPCTAEERWERKGAFAVMKPGGKRSMRNLPTKDEAEAYIKNTGLTNLKIEERLSVQTRCLSYCLAAPWCEQKKAMDAEKSTKTA